MNPSRWATPVALKDWGRRYWKIGGWGQRFALWLAAEEVVAYGSYGNGASMRVSPAGPLATSVDHPIELAQTVTCVTHSFDS